MANSSLRRLVVAGVLVVGCVLYALVKDAAATLPNEIATTPTQRLDRQLKGESSTVGDAASLTDNPFPDDVHDLPRERHGSNSIDRGVKMVQDSNGERKLVFGEGQESHDSTVGVPDKKYLLRGGMHSHHV